MRSRPYLLLLPAAMSLAGCAGSPVEEAPLPAVATARAARRTEMPKTPNVQTETPRKESEPMSNEKTEPKFPVMKTDAEWKKILTPEQYYILREKGTERPFSGKYEAFDEVGTYTCAACGQELFQSSAKFESGCGWPSFFEALDPSKVTLQEDLSHGMRRTEVLCSRCGGHLGHVFDDGPRPTGKRFCINSGSLNFRKAGDTP